MARPNLQDSFLEQGFSVSKKGTKIIYYGFCNVDEVKGMVDMIKKESKKFKKKIKIMKIKKAGEIAPYKFRWRIEIRIL